MRDFQLPGRSLVMARNGMIATSHPLASKVGVQMLESGGNAVDAAIAAAILLGICEPQMTGIGGDLFVLVKPGGSDEIIGLNGSGKGPAGLDAARLRAAGHAQIPPGSADAVTVPGAIDAFVELSRRFGKRTLADVLAPAVYYADAGVPVAPRVAADWVQDAPVLQGVARDLYLVDGAVPAPGTLFRAPLQAEVLRTIAAEGRAGFYEGWVAEDMIATLRQAGGSHTPEDFANTACDWVTPISGTYRGLELVEMPPNGQGATAILLANILSHFDIAALDPVGAERVHLTAEATKLAYDARNRFVSDPASMGTRLEHMLSMETAAALAALIDPKRAMTGPAELSEAVHKETIYLSVVDGDGMAVSLIYSIFHGFGSGLACPRTGILLHNRGAGFTLEEGHPNEAGPGKRPMHTIIPAMLKKDGKVIMPFGVMGGQYQAAGHAHVISNIADFGMDPQEALDLPRAFPEAGELRLERGFADSVRTELEALGHKVVTPPTPIGGAQAILIGPDGLLTGASDPRKDGCALGY